MLRNACQYQTLVELLRVRMSDAPSKHAYTYLRDGETDALTWDYGELDRRARAIAAWLQSCGAAGERALLLYPPGLDYLAAFFGCLYAGVVAVPAYPPQRQRGWPRVRAILADSQAAYALTTSGIARVIDRLSVKEDGYGSLATLQWLNTDNVPSGVDEDWSEPDITAETLAFLQYTSGSTGLPKGVMVSHANLLHNQRLIQEAFGHTSQDVIVGWLPLYHDMGLIGNVLQPLYLGASCIFMSPVHFLQKPVRWLSAITRYRATTSGGPNFSYDLCVRQITEAQRELLDLSSWTLAFNGAEPVRAATIERFSDRFRDRGFRKEAFYPCYGLAEATLLVSGGTRGAGPLVQPFERSRLRSEPPASASGSASHLLVSCGVDRSGRQIRIVHPDSGIACADGQEGEIWVGGPCVAQGYWQREAESRETFQASLAGTGERPFLRTGDLGFLKNGELFVTGRLKDLIIIRGRNHYPHDIERTVEECHPALRPGAGAAFAITEGDEEQLVVVQEMEPRSQALDLQAVTTAIRQTVAQAHEVSVFAVVLIKAGTLPKTSSGKVQRSLCRDKFLARELIAVEESVLRDSSAAVVVEEEPATVGDEDGLEQVLADIWSQVLNRPNVESGDDFFALGGDSLRGLQVVARVREVRGLDVPLDALFDHPTLAAFSAHVATCLPADPGAPIESIRRVSRDETLPLSFAQERFWFLDQLSSGSSINNIPVALRLVGALDVEALRRSLDEIIQRHEILRACFALRNGRPSHFIVPQLILALDIEDLRTSVEPDREAQILRLAGEEACRPFDLANGPLIRGCLFRLDDMNHVLSLTLHHIVADGWSMDVLRRELASLYEAFKDGRPSPLPALSIQYVDLIAAQRERPKGAADRRLLEYWANQLEGAPPLLNLPWDYPRPAIQGHRGARHPWMLEPELARRLYEVGARYRATPFMLLVSALGLLLSRYSRQTDFCIGTPVANRAGREAEQLVGCFVNTVVLRMDVSGNPSLPALLDRVRVMVLGAQSHQDLSFERLVDELGVVRDLSHTPLFQVMFVLEDSPSDVRRFADLEASRLNVGTGTSVFDLTLEMAQKTDGSLDAVFEYSTDLFAADTIARMAGHLQALLRQIVASPEASVSELSILSPGEQALELADSRSPREAYPQEASLHRLIEAQASKTPDAVALQCDRGPITYDSLNRLGNQLARYLRVQGIVPEAPVALCVDRSLEMAIGLLGCLKAGATYVPVDPSYPAERQAAIFRDAQPHLLLTQGRHLESLPEHTAPVLALDAGWPAVAGLPDDNLVTGPNPDHLAYLLYTSGTTGNPKGIGITHRALVNHGLAMVQAYDLSPADRVLQFASVSFDVAVEECFPTWLAGATVVLRPNEPVPAYGDFQAFLHAQGVTVLNLPTPYWAGWAEESERTAAAIPSSVRLVIVGSEKALPDDLRRWRRAAGEQVDWCNSYGPTEATITASTYRPGPAQDGTVLQTIPIGRPIANVEMYVLDRHLHPVPAGVPGDLYIGGPGLARGYHRQPALTAAQFIPHPFSHDRGARLYRTGDVARRRSDGNLEFLGRADEQVKIRGFRVEPQEIECHVRAHPEVKDARVFLESDAPGDWTAVLAGLGDEEQDRLVRDVEALSAAEARWLYDLESDGEQRRKTVIQRKPEFEVYLKINKEEFLTPPRANQRNWLLRRALDEFSDDLLALDEASKRFVSGSDRADIERGWAESRAEYNPSELIIEGQQVMQDWEAPLMKAMADIVTDGHGDVLEVGFGMGISASYIQAGRPRSHTIIECNRDVMRAFAEWTDKYPDRDIRLVQGRWQDVVEDIGLFDGVFFDTYPASEAEFEESVINSINFAEGFIPVAAKLLRPGGVFTYYTNEIDSFSRRHQRFLLDHFGSFTLSIVRSLLPPDDCHYWWADSMAVVKAVK